MWKEFKDFLIKQNAVALALAVVIGAALNKVVQSLVNDLLMPVIGRITSLASAGDWEGFKLEALGMKFGLGDLLSALINFLIIGFVCWRISKLITPVPTPVRNCQFCKMPIDAAATRCPHCTSQLAATAG